MVLVPGTQGINYGEAGMKDRQWWMLMRSWPVDLYISGLFPMKLSHY